MGRQINRLSPRAVATAKKPGMLADGGGLYLQITVSGAKTWIYRFTIGGKTRDMGLGSLHTAGLARAREMAAEARVLVQDRIDPIEHRKAHRLASDASSAKVMTFRQCAEAYIEAHKSGWKNAKHADQWASTLKTYAYPILGNLAASDVDTGLVLKVLEPVWNKKNETASRLRGRIESVLDWAKVRNHRQGENPARWRGHLALTLPKPSKVQKVKHHTALPYKEMGAFMVTLRERGDLSAKALEFIILTATRTGESIGAKWSEIDLDSAIWTIPPDRMKGPIEHRVPLSSAALTILKNLPQVTGNPYVFPGLKPKRPLSNMACLSLLKRMGPGDLTVHGFRSTFRDWTAEQTAFPREAAERALAHTLKDKVEAAYQRGDLFEKRRKLMEAWADYCAVNTSEHDNVTPIRKKEL